jgi:hypothetical protein
MKANTYKFLFITILILGIGARVWRFGDLPAGLNQDEASSAMDSYYVLRYGMDRNGISYPVQFMMWGGGQSSLHEYLLIPFIAFGLNSFTTRLPMLISGILTLFLVYFAARRIAGERYAFIAMFLLAISPWHIMMTRWSLNDNMLPFFFLAGFLSVLRSEKDNRWFVVGCAFFAVCFYAYGAAYIVVPVFLLVSIPAVMYAQRATCQTIILGLGVLFVLSIPILLFVAMNFFGLDTIHLGPFTIPRFPVAPRYESLSAMFGENGGQMLVDNTLTMFRLLTFQSDGLIWNSIPAYGYFYNFTFPVALVGLSLLLASNRAPFVFERRLLLAWMIASFAIGTQVAVNLNRINSIFIPLLLCIALVLEYLVEKYRSLFYVVIFVFLAAFGFFLRDYFGKPYQAAVGREFSAGLLPAMNFAVQAGDGPICVSDKPRMPYIFALMAEKPTPLDYLATVKYVNPDDEFREVSSFGRFTFGAQNCRAVPEIIYVLREEEQPPSANVSYTVHQFGMFNVYVRQRN